jgi:hypothetical protein
MCSEIQVRGRLTQRKDDTEERVRLRLDLYREVCVANVLLMCSEGQVRLRLDQFRDVCVCVCVCVCVHTHTHTNTH